jgi:hypothetical protein
MDIRNIDTLKYNVDLAVIEQSLGNNDGGFHQPRKRLEKQVIDSLGMNRSRSAFTVNELAACSRACQKYPLSPEWLEVESVMGCSRIIDHEIYLIYGNRPKMILTHTYVPKSALKPAVEPLASVGLVIVEFGLGSYHCPEGALMLGLCTAETAGELGLKPAAF